MKKFVLLALPLIFIVSVLLFIFSKSEFQEDEKTALEPLPTVKVDKVPASVPLKTVVESSENENSPTLVLVENVGNATTITNDNVAATKPSLAQKMVELKQFIDSLKIDSENDPEGLQWNAGLSTLDINLQNFLNDPSFGREEKIANLWNLVNQVEYGTPASYVIDTLSKLYPFEISNQIIDAFQIVASQGDATTIRQLELLSLLKAGLNMPKEDLTISQMEQFQQAVAQTKSLLNQQLYSYSNSAVFKESLSLYYDIVTLPESIETFPKIADAIANDVHLKGDFYAIWAQSTFAHRELQPAIEVLFDSQLPKSDIDEINSQVFEVLKNFSAGDVIDDVRSELVNYLKKQEPPTEKPQDYLKWMNAYIAIQSSDEMTKNISLGHLIANDKESNFLLQAHAVEYLGSETILSTWESKDVTLLVNNLQKAEREQKFSQQDQIIILNALSQLTSVK